MSIVGSVKPLAGKFDSDQRSAVDSLNGHEDVNLICEAQLNAHNINARLQGLSPVQAELYLKTLSKNLWRETSGFAFDFLVLFFDIQPTFPIIALRYREIFAFKPLIGFYYKYQFPDKEYLQPDPQISVYFAPSVNPFIFVQFLAPLVSTAPPLMLGCFACLDFRLPYEYFNSFIPILFSLNTYWISFTCIYFNSLYRSYFLRKVLRISRNGETTFHQTTVSVLPSTQFKSTVIGK
ncbi:unnamed protein product, partial [Mesorhabditis belari]|uniref:Uncharacterized protein n=1 Tax=Mesorhabditis belari TaxID=2138241 RepID=A0AAF3FQV9_9BILA